MSDQQFYQVETYDESNLASQPHNMDGGVKGGVFRVKQDGSTETLGVTSYNSTTPDLDNGHPFDYATDFYGRYVPFSKFSGDTLITLNGTTATLSQFEQLGLTQQQNGRWQVADMDVVAGMEQAEKQQQEADDYEALDLHPDAIESALNSFIEPVPQPVYDAALARFADTLDISKVDIAGIAQSSGISDRKAREGLTFIAESFQQQLTQELGGDTEAIMSWAKQHREGDLKSAMRQLLMERSLSGVRSLATDFASDCSTPEQENRAVNYLRSQGISVRKSDNKWVVKTDAGETNLQNAFKQGYVRWTGKKAK